VKPVLFVLPVPWVGPLAIKSYGFMIMLGFLFGLWLALRRARKENVNPDVIWDFWVYGLIGGIVGGRILYILENLDQFNGHWLGLFRIWEGGLSFFGGFGLAAVGTWIMLRIRKVSVLKVYDIMVVSLALGLAFGKMGCFLNGCCFGRLTTSFTGVTYPVSTPFDGAGATRHSPAFEWQSEHGVVGPDATQCLPIQPVQLYEAAAALGIVAVLLLFYPHRKRYGEVTCLFGTLYPLVRFFFEFVREPEHIVVLGLTPEQIFCVITFVCFATVFIISRKKQPTLAI